MTAATLLGASMAAMLAWAAVSDLRTRLIPDGPLLAGGIAALGIAVAAAPETLPERLAAAAAAGGFLLVAALLRPGGMGLGDVKLAAILGLFLGRTVAWALLAALVAGALAGVLLLIRHGRAARSRTIPFAPYLATGAALALMGADNVAPWS